MSGWARRDIIAIGAVEGGRRLAHPGKGVVCMVEMILAILLVVAITEAVKYIKK